jgi:fructose-1,6-bisphosphatase/inositol monophosphatase family enzyme
LVGGGLLGMVSLFYISSFENSSSLPRDVAAGIAILLEAGGLVTTANPPDDISAPIAPVKLGSRLYLAIR